jgi:mono/diheme cytochrome c family protein
MRRFWFLSFGLPLAIALLLAAALLRPGAFGFSTVSQGYAATIPAARDSVDRGIITLAFGDWGGLTSDALQGSATAWKLANAALALQETGGNVARAGTVDLAAVYRRFGFHSPAAIGNWPTALPAPDLYTPVGLNTGFGGGIWPPVGATIANVGCAACHSSVMYDATGAPDLGRVWLGAPNTSINTEAWGAAIFAALRDHGGDADTLFEALDDLYPDTGWRERRTLRRTILPALMAEVRARDAAIGRHLPYRASLAGSVNRIDRLRDHLGLIPPDAVVTDSVFSPIPDLGGRLWRTGFLATGGHAIPGIDPATPLQARHISADHREGLAGIIAYFSVTWMGVPEVVAERNISDATNVTAWMATYVPQAFPGPIDDAALPLGQAIYARACASCHGTYDDSVTHPRLIAFPNWHGDVGTDPAQAAAFTPAIAAAINDGRFGSHVAARSAPGYAAPPLSGLWASAPYLHNGSVPTLWHLMRPETRPAWFAVGGHRIDMLRVGIDLAPPVGYVPWSIPSEVDTRTFGLSNAGHSVGFDDLQEAEKEALLEYLKLL